MECNMFFFASGAKICRLLNNTNINLPIIYLGWGYDNARGVELLYIIIIIYDDVAVLGCLVLVICAIILPKNDRHMEYNDKHWKGVRRCKEGGLDMNE